MFRPFCFRGSPWAAFSSKSCRLAKMQQMHKNVLHFTNFPFLGSYIIVDYILQIPICANLPEAATRKDIQERITI